jgi:hypothetical protein
MPRADCRSTSTVPTTNATARQTMLMDRFIVHVQTLQLTPSFGLIPRPGHDA